MSFRFRPRLNALEARDVPAAFSFQLSDGTTGAGSFSDPHADDSRSYTLELSDVVLMYGGATYQPVGSVEAWYDYGSLMEVFGTLSGPAGDTISLLGDSVARNGYSAPLAIDTADTQATFTLPDGTVSAISYAMPYDQIDATQASQSITLSTFNLNIAGQNFTLGSASFTTAPTLNFSYGDLQSVSFALDTSATAGFAYTSISAAGGTITAQLASNGQFINAPMAGKFASIGLDFSTITMKETSTYKIRVTVDDGTQNGRQITVSVNGVGTKQNLRDAFEQLLKDAGVKATATGDTGLDIKGTATFQLKKVEVADFNLDGDDPKLEYRTPGPDGIRPDYVIIY